MITTPGPVTTDSTTTSTNGIGINLNFMVKIIICSVL